MTDKSPSRAEAQKVQEGATQALEGMSEVPMRAFEMMGWSTAYVAASSDSMTEFTRGTTDLVMEVLRVSQEQAREGAETLMRCATCQSPAEAMEIQNRFMTSTVERAAEEGRKVPEQMGRTLTAAWAPLRQEWERQAQQWAHAVGRNGPGKG